MKLDFFIIGAQKCGTTALHSMLNEFSGIQMSVPKELHFFDNESVNWNQPDYTNLHASFDWTVEEMVRGEATPIYCYWPNSLERIYNYNPNAKIIMLLRHPVYRAYSQWRMEYQRGLEELRFSDAISSCGRTRVSGAPGGVHRIFSYVERGLYASQINRLLTLFSLDKIIFLRTDELWGNPNRVINGIAKFLNVQNLKIYNKSTYVAPEIKIIQQINFNEDNYLFLDILMNIYKKDIEEVQEKTGLNLTDWLERNYCEVLINEKNAFLS
jgi:hypothetical protein